MSAELSNHHFDAGIVANDRVKALVFWHELLGFPIEGEVNFAGMTIIRLQIGAAILRLCIPDLEVRQKAATGAFDAATGLRYLTIGVRNLDALVTTVAAAGYPVPFAPREIRPGYRVAQIQDGQGVTVELVESVQA